MPFTFLTAEWRKLIMMQYEVPRAVLERRLPPGVELDLFHGRAFVSLVGFLFDRVRILGVPVPFHTRFEEVNLRYYVRRPVAPGTPGAQPETQYGSPPATPVRRGVVFLSEIVPKPAITLVARALYGEAYATAPTSHWWSSEGPDARAVRRGEQPLVVRYDWRGPRLRRNAYRGEAQSMAVRASSTSEPIAPGSLNEFITEHYWGYAPTQSLPGHPRGTTEYAVEHPRWQVYPVQEYEVRADFGALYGPEFAGLTDRAPDHILLAEGAPVRIRWGGSIA